MEKYNSEPLTVDYEEVHIVVYKHNMNIVDYQNLITLVQEQMSFIGYVQSREEIDSELKNSMKEGSRAVLFVAYNIDEKVLGFAFGNICCGLETKGDYFWLNELYVSPKARNHGLGSMLLRYVQSWSKENGSHYVALVTHPNNKKAQELYQQDNFELESLVWVDKYL
ncbi:MAG: GNAT family N-acetyltransferase [Spirochaetia bacterium]|nr:GNAT family N-acetyltransferase [Spirochaetia bacterium]